ncbi:hypothetical protein Mkiyose1088_44790 [Mycobacterium kiyosense]|uniref:Uncharacterized protein n=2 Tax=Mycobacteriaceae TaxID=1762 RepID=A0A9P3QBM8_9MYCO|nr:hypothetical protein IWGMT90018_17180 [Mycobacterium kiyosense]BDE13028.1 hypothetical protein MKCMC460_18880 [Mycobacterium sp. 20KCMC460]GLB81986.1 hypothetical protein SRL2020028_12420 [Mycobacterium kiyosense]GLB89497.1 hypothetical protein SRL2020130_23140 [Mycobacterium kiyosense]GLB95127.1 hypothetical protein SRL2020226_19030 [Mycobacterium kiyosense]
MALLQPCTVDRHACGPAHWIGPIDGDGDAAALRDWLEHGQWESTPLPTRLARHSRWVNTANESN